MEIEIDLKFKLICAPICGVIETGNYDLASMSDLSLV